MKKYHCIFEKIKKKSENPDNITLNFKEQIILWLEALSVSERAMVLSIENEWIIGVLSHMNHLSKNESEVLTCFAIDFGSSDFIKRDKFIKRKSYFKPKFFSGIEICQIHSLTRKLIYYIFPENENSYTDELSDKLSNNKPNNDKVVYYPEYNSNCKATKSIQLSKKGNLSALKTNKHLKGFLSFRKEDLEDITSLLKLFDILSDGDFLKSQIDISYEKDNQIYQIDFPKWFNKDDHNNFGKFITAFIEQSIFIKYIICNFTEDFNSTNIFTSNIENNKAKLIKQNNLYLHSAPDKVIEAWKLEEDLKEFMKEYDFSKINFSSIKEKIISLPEYNESMEIQRERFYNNPTTTTYISSCYETIDTFPKELRQIYLNHNKNSFISYLFQVNLHNFQTAGELTSREIIRILIKDYKDKLSQELILDFEVNQDKEKKPKKGKEKKKTEKPQIKDDKTNSFKNTSLSKPEIKTENVSLNNKNDKSKKDNKKKKNNFFLFNTIGKKEITNEENDEVVTEQVKEAKNDKINLSQKDEASIIIENSKNVNDCDNKDSKDVKDNKDINIKERNDECNDYNKINKTTIIETNHFELQINNTKSLIKKNSPSSFSQLSINNKTYECKKANSFQYYNKTNSSIYQTQPSNFISSGNIYQNNSYFTLNNYSLFQNPNNEINFFNKLKTDIHDFIKIVNQNNSSLNQIKTYIRNEIENILKNSNTKFVFNKELEFLRNNINIFTFGSLATNLSIECSDVDILVTYNNLDNIDKKGENGIVNPEFFITSDKLFKYVLKILPDSKLFSNILPILTASVPIIKLKCKTELACKLMTKSDLFFENIKSSLTFIDFPFNKEEFFELKFDLSFMNLQKNSGHKVERNEESKLYTQKSIIFINTTCDFYSEIRPLMLILKRLLTQVGLNSYYNGGLSSYSLFFLVYGYVKFFKNKSNSDSIEYVLFNFFEFYGKILDFSRTIIDCSNPSG